MVFYLRSNTNTIPLCVVRWEGAGHYAGVVSGNAYVVFRVASPEQAQKNRVGYIRHYKALHELLQDLKNKGGYER